jgi:hypothetical protein
MYVYIIKVKLRWSDKGSPVAVALSPEKAIGLANEYMNKATHWGAWRHREESRGASWETDQDYRLWIAVYEADTLDGKLGSESLLAKYDELGGLS